MGAALVGIFIALAVWIPIPAGFLESPRWIAALLGTGVLFVSAVPLFTSRFTRAQSAQIADLKLETQALFVTAENALCKIESSQTIGEAEQSCLERAWTKAQETNPPDVVPMNFGVRWAVLLLPICLGLAIALTPFAVDEAAAVEQQQISAATQVLETFDKKLQEQKRKGLALDASLEKKLRRLTKRLKAGEITRREAVEEIGDIKQQLRAEQLKKAQRSGKANQASQSAAQELSKSPWTKQLGKQLGKGAQSSAKQDRPNPKQQAQQLEQDLRRLSSLSREQREQAAKSLEQAAQKAEQSGDPQLAQQLQQAADAVRNGDDSQLGKIANNLQQKLQPSPQNLNNLDQQLGQALSQAQQRLGQPPNAPTAEQLRAINGQGQISNDESRVAPQPRDWSPGNSKTPGNGKSDQPTGAGHGHQDEEATATETTQGHQDANRFNKETPETWDAEYQELYEAALLNSDNRVGTRVKGQRNKTGKIDTVRGGEQTPRHERARRALQAIPAGYAQEAREAIGKETVPPGYRNAVRDYFDPSAGN